MIFKLGRIAPLFLTLLLGGCPKEPLPPLVLEEVRLLEQPPREEEREALLYRLLLAELALQKRQLPEALRHYLELARETRDPLLIRRAAAIAAALRDQRALSDLLELWLEVEPEAIEARRRAVLVAAALGEPLRALPHLLFLFQKERDLAERLLLHLAEQKRLSEELLEKLKERLPDHPEIDYAAALFYFEEGQEEKALQALLEGLKKAKRFGQRPLSLERLLERLVAQKASGLLEKLTERAPDEPTLWLARLQLLIQEGRQQEAEALLRRLLARWPDHPKLLWTRALLALQEGRLEEAEPLLRRLLRHPEWKSRAALYLGHIAGQKGRLKEALRWYEKVEEGDLLFEAEMGRASTLIRMGRFKEAEELLDRLSFEYPHPAQQARIALLRAQLHLQREEPEAAFALLNDALRRFPDHPDLLYLRALVADQLGREEVALQDLRRLVELRPGDPQALNALGYTLLDRFGKLEEARPYIEKAFQLMPDDPAIKDSYGWLLFKEGKPKEALRYLQEAYRQHPDPEIGAHLAEVLLTLGKVREARRVWLEVKKRARGHRLRLWVETFGKRLRE